MLVPCLTTRERCCRVLRRCIGLLCLTVPFPSAAVQPPGENKPRPQLPSQVGAASLCDGSPSLQHKATWRTFKGILNLMCSCCVSSSHCLRAAAFYIRGLLSFFQGRYNEAKYGKSSNTSETTLAQSYFVQLVTQVQCLVPQAFSEGNLEDVQRRRPEQTDGVLSGSAWPHLLRAGQPQGKTDQWYTLYVNHCSTAAGQTEGILFRLISVQEEWNILEEVKLRNHPVCNVLLLIESLARTMLVAMLDYMI